jgi:3-oxoacyl-[acyl-carrier-protein] synthase II
VRRRVAVTLVEAVTPLGDDLASTFAALADGKTGFTAVTGFEVSTAVNDKAAAWTARRSAGEALTAVLARVAAQRGPIVVDRAYFAGTPDESPPKVPDVVGRTGPEGGEEGGWDRVYTGACTSSSSALIDAAAAVAHGWCDRVLVAAARMLDRETFHVFSAGGAMTREAWMRPLTTQRSGVLLGEGAAVFVLESEEALGDGVPLAEISGWGRTGDAFHPFQPDPSGRGLAEALREALDAAELTPDRIGLVSVHGTGTELNDATEIAALTGVFGRAATPPVHAPKASLGHTLEAAGLVESAVAVRSLVCGVIPPTPGVLPDGDVLVDSVTTVRALEPGLSHLAKLNLAFGGCNTVVILSRWSDRTAPRAWPPDGSTGESLRLRARVGTEPGPPPIQGFMRSGFPAAVYDAANRCLDAAGLSRQERTRTAVVVLTPRGDTETKAAVRACLDAGQRPPPPLFVQSTPPSIVGLIARKWHLGGGVNVVASERALDDPQIVGMATELAAAERATAVLLIRHLPPSGDAPSTAEAVLYSR